MPRIMNYRPTVLDGIIGASRSGGRCSCRCAREGEQREEEYESEIGRRRRFVPRSSASPARTFQRRMPMARAKTVRRRVSRVRPRTAARANTYFSKRLGWGKRFGSVARRMRWPVMPPGSLALAMSIARWQAMHGLDPTGVIDATTWAMLQSQTAAPGEPPVDAGGADAAGPDDQAPEPASGDAGAPMAVDAGGDSTGGQEAEGFI